MLVDRRGSELSGWRTLVEGGRVFVEVEHGRTLADFLEPAEQLGKGGPLAQILLRARQKVFSVFCTHLTHLPAAFHRVTQLGSANFRRSQAVSLQHKPSPTRAITKSSKLTAFTFSLTCLSVNS